MSLSQIDKDFLQAILIRDEGLEPFPYMDCCGRPFRTCLCSYKGKLSIGIGRNLDDVGLTEEECVILLTNDINKAVSQSEKAFPWFESLNPARKIVVVCMVFNMGLATVKKFKNMLAAIADQDFKEASFQMLQSKWAKDVGKRAIILSHIMETGILK